MDVYKSTRDGWSSSCRTRLTGVLVTASRLRGDEEKLSVSFHLDPADILALSLLLFCPPSTLFSTLLFFFLLTPFLTFQIYRSHLVRTLDCVALILHSTCKYLFLSCTYFSFCFCVLLATGTTAFNVICGRTTQHSTLLHYNTSSPTERCSLF